jgi:hypothetical protein
MSEKLMSRVRVCFLMEHDVNPVGYYAHALADVVIATIAALVAIAVVFPVTAVAGAAKRGTA